MRTTATSHSDVLSSYQYLKGVRKSDRQKSNLSSEWGVHISSTNIHAPSKATQKRFTTMSAERTTPRPCGLPRRLLSNDSRLFVRELYGGTIIVGWSYTITHNFHIHGDPETRDLQYGLIRINDYTFLIEQTVVTSDEIRTALYKKKDDSILVLSIRWYVWLRAKRAYRHGAESELSAGTNIYKFCD